MATKELVMKAAELCGVPNAARYAWIAETVWDAEANGNPIFARTKEDEGNEIARLYPGFSWLGLEKDQEKAVYIQRLVILNMYAHYVKQHGLIGFQNHVDALTKGLTEDEPKYTDVSSLMTVEQAATGVWM